MISPKARALFLPALIIVIVSFFGSGCVNTRNMVYMQGSFDTAALSKVQAAEPTIRKGDLVSIIVYSDNPDATKIYNQSIITTGSGAGASGGISGSTPSAGGYQVDENGNIIFQGLGKLHVEGLTKAALKDTLDARLTAYLSNPYYNIRFLNYKFTVLGEVARPGVITIPGEKLNLLEAFSLAGDINFYGRRDNVLIIRETNGIRQWGRLDLTKPEAMASPFFYVQQNDIVVVEPSRKKAIANDAVTTRNVTLAVTAISTLALIYSIFRR